MNVNERPLRKWNIVPVVNYTDPFPVNLGLFLTLQALLQFGEQEYNFLFHIVPTQYFIHPSVSCGHDVWNSLQFGLFAEPHLS